MQKVLKPICFLHKWGKCRMPNFLKSDSLREMPHLVTIFWASKSYTNGAIKFGGVGDLDP